MVSPNNGIHPQWQQTGLMLHRQTKYPPPPCVSYANVHNYYSPYTYCSLDKGVACA